MELLQKNVQRAKANKQRIVLPEGLEPRTLQAADRILADGIAHIILLGNPAEIQAKAAELGLKHIDQAEIIDPQNHARREAYRDLLMELRKAKGMTREQADELVVNPLYLACLMIKSGDADGEVAGAHNTTGNVLRPALQLIKTRPGLKVVSGAFLIFSPLKEYGENGFFIFADCAVTPNPDSNELAQIAIASADTARSIGDMEPRVALLSYSTKGSAKSEMIDKVTEAYTIAKEMAPDLLIDGELQADAAIVSKIAELKAPESPVAGKANVLVFPNLEVGNVAYKLVERLGRATAVGPILQGMAAPVNDLSRGCSVDDVYNVITITCNQAIAAKK